MNRFDDRRNQISRAVPARTGPPFGRPASAGGRALPRPGTVCRSDTAPFAANAEEQARSRCPPNMTTPSTTTLADRTIGTPRAIHDDLATVVPGLSEVQLSGPSGASEWPVAQVLSHLGSGAELALAGLTATVSWVPAPAPEFNQTVWDRWNTIGPRDPAAGFLRHDAALVRRGPGFATGTCMTGSPPPDRHRHPTGPGPGPVPHGLTSGPESGVTTARGLPRHPVRAEPGHVTGTGGGGADGRCS